MENTANNPIFHPVPIDTRDAIDRATAVSIAYGIRPILLSGEDIVVCKRLALEAQGNSGRGHLDIAVLASEGTIRTHIVADDGTACRNHKCVDTVAACIDRTLTHQ